MQADPSLRLAYLKGSDFPLWTKLTGTLKITCTISSHHLFALWPAETITGRQLTSSFWLRFLRILIINVSGCEDAFTAVDALTFHMPQILCYAFCVTEILPLKGR